MKRRHKETLKVRKRYRRVYLHLQSLKFQLEHKMQENWKRAILSLRGHKIVLNKSDNSQLANIFIHLI